MPRRRIGVQPTRGPKRATGSRVKIICAFKGCTQRDVCVKNKGITASYAAVDLSKTRKVHAAAKLVRFCSTEHRQRCLLKDKKPRGGREALTAQQIVHLFGILAWQRPWAAVFFAQCHVRRTGRGYVSCLRLLATNHRLRSKAQPARPPREQENEGS